MQSVERNCSEIKHAYFSDLAVIVTDTLFIGTSDSDVTREIEANCWSIQAGSTIAACCGVEDFRSFFHAVIENRKQQILSHEASVGMIFYCWVDGMAGQLRFNLISSRNTLLPFKVEVDYCSLEEVIREFLNLGTHDGIPCSDLADVSAEEILAVVDSSRYRVRVYQQLLP